MEPRTRQLRRTPLTVAKQPAGEVPPACDDDHAGELRTFVDVPGYSDGIAFCAPGAADWEVLPGAETIQDVIGAILVDSTSINFTYADGTPSITAVAIFGSGSGTVAEGNHTHAATSPISSQSKTIASGVVTLDAITAGIATILLMVDTQGAAASDDLDTISVTGSVADGTLLFVQSVANARDVVCKHNTGNLIHRPAADFTLMTTNDTATYRRSGSSWVMVASAT